MQKSRKTNTTKFKLAVYWFRRENGTPYTQFEMSNNWHRRYIPSFDYKNGMNGIKYIRHDEAYQKQLDFITKHWNNIKYAELWMNDFENKLEVCCGIWDSKDHDKIEIKQIKIQAFDVDTNNRIIFRKENNNQHVFCVGIDGGGIKVSDLRINYKNKAA